MQKKSQGTLTGRQSLLLIFLVALIIVGGCAGNNKPLDQQITNDAYDNKHEQLMLIKIRGVNVDQDLARAFVEVKTKYIKDVADETLLYDFKNGRWYAPKNRLLHKKGEARGGSLTLYYLKTDRAWLKIDHDAYLAELRRLQRSK